jgi:hypothetical protein
MQNKFKIPDLNAPRFYQKRHYIINDEFIDKLVKKYPKFEGASITELKRIIKAFNTNLWKEVIENRDGVKLPESVGTIFIGTCPPSKSQYNPDYSLLHKQNITASNKNWETDGNIAKIFFTSYAEKYKYRFREHWNFTACREFKRTLAKEYPKNWTMYHVVSTKLKLSQQFKFEKR